VESIDPKKIPMKMGDYRDTQHEKKLIQTMHLNRFGVLLRLCIQWSNGFDLLHVYNNIENAFIRNALIVY